MLGTEEDWKKILTKVEKLKEFDSTLSEWSDVLSFVLDNFVSAFSGTFSFILHFVYSPFFLCLKYLTKQIGKIDKDFWNRIAQVVGGGSGPRHIEGWILSLIAFDSKGNYFLNDLSNIKSTNNYGSVVLCFIYCWNSIYL